MRSIDSFTRLSAVNKTLRFRLIPIGNSESYIKKKDIVALDKRKAQLYTDGKQLLDNGYKAFIERILKDYNLDTKNYDPVLYHEMAEALINFQKDKTNNRKALQDIQAKCRLRLVNHMTTFPEFEDLKKGNQKKIIDSVFKSYPAGSIDEIINEFKRFAGYFQGYCKNRSNLFSDKEISVSIAYRVIHDNFPKFHKNIKVYEFLRSKHPDLYTSIIQSLQSNMGNDFDMYFLIENYPLFITQKGIDAYNLIISGSTPGPSEVKIQGFNELVNLYCQKNSEVKKRDLLMVPLFKQILSDRETASFVIDKYENEQQMIEDISTVLSPDFYFNLKSIAEHISLLIPSMGEDVFVSNVQMRTISLYLYGKWDALANAIEVMLQTKIINEKKKINKTDLKKIESFLKSKFFPISVLFQAVAYNENVDNHKTIDDYFKVEIPSLWKKVELSHKEYLSLLDQSEQIQIKGNKENLHILKTYLDSVLQLVQTFRGFIPPSDYEIDASFYEPLLEYRGVFKSITSLYDKVRNFMTTKNQAEKKFKLNFNSPILADGWDKNKEKDYLCIILRRKGNYYLGIMDSKRRTDFNALSQNYAPEKSIEPYEKMVYKYIPPSNKMFPKVLFPKSNKFPVPVPDNILSCITKKRANNSSNYFAPEFDSLLEFERALIAFYIDAIPLYGDWKDYNMQFKEPAEYESLNDFYTDVEKQNYKVHFTDLAVETIDKLVSDGKLYLFQIYNKDYAQGSTGKKNMHTLYWEQAFSEQNLRDVVIKLDGQAELFFRPGVASKEDNPTHPIGSKVVNKSLKDGRNLPTSIHDEIYHFVNNRLLEKELSPEAKALYPEVTIKEVTHSLTSGKRFKEDQYFFHVPLTLNYKAQKRVKINDEVIKMLKNETSCNIIGIDRGERNLIYISVIDQRGNILHQQSLNSIPNRMNSEIDYQEKLKDAELSRDRARKSWSSIGKIKDLKEGYLSQIVHEIAKLVIKYNAIIVLEDLNYGFKRGRFKVERQVYQKFEAALINKLNYLVFKELEYTAPGGVLNAYQLTQPFVSFEKLGKQTGWIFYVPASHTSKIDPVTGFANLFNLKNMTNYEKKFAFFKNFDNVRYDNNEEAFLFTFDYSNFDCFIKQPQGSSWTLSSRGERILYNSSKKEVYRISPTEELKHLFLDKGIEYDNGNDILPDILGLEPDGDIKQFFDKLYRSFIQILQMRNSDSMTGEDYILSPVKNKEGDYYDSRNYTTMDSFPCDADANGAYNIARKGLLCIKHIKDDNIKDNEKLKIPPFEWIKSVRNV